MSDIEDLTRRMREFTDARDWCKFHDPKSLVLALVGEVGELAELLQWLPHDVQTRAVHEEPLRSRLAEEMSDVLLYLLRLADVADVDLFQAANAKLEANDRRFRPEEHRGVAPTRPPTSPEAGMSPTAGPAHPA